MIDREQTLAAYERAWTRRDEPQIRAELKRCWTPDSTYVSPLTDVVRGVEGLTGLILDFPVMFPGAQVRPTSAPDIHHDVAYFTWQLTSTTRIRTMGRDFGRSLDGVDIVEFGDGNRIRRIIAFFGIDRLTLRRTAADRLVHYMDDSMDDVDDVDGVDGVNGRGRPSLGRVNGTGRTLDLTRDAADPAGSEREPLLR